MALQIKVDNLNRLVAKLQQREGKLRRAGKVNCAVGYSQSYAIYVHEILTSHHPIGQAKFLEEPARTKAPEIAATIGRALRQGIEMGMALYLGGLRLQRESQALVPIDSGALRASAFTRLERGR